MEGIEARAEVRYVDAAGLARALPGAQALFLWDFFSCAVRDNWAHADALQWIHVAAAGIDTLMFDELVASDVVVTNARGIFDRPIAEFVLGSILAVAKDFRGSLELQRRREWRHRETRRVAGTHALVIGTGSIGRETARLLRAVGIEVSGAGRTARGGDPDFGEIVASENLAAHVSDVDHLVVIAPLTDSTRNLVNADVLSAMKPGSHLINVARGPIVDEDALLDALEHGPLAAATLDVFHTEPLPADHPLWTTPGVAISAHMSGDVTGWRDALADQFTANARRWLDGETPHNVVDKENGFVPAPPAPTGDKEQA